MKTHLSSPPSTAIDWHALRIKPELAPAPITVRSRVWFEARALAMAELDCGPDDLVVSPKPDALDVLFGKGSAIGSTIRDYAAFAGIEPKVTLVKAEPTP